MSGKNLLQTPIIGNKIRALSSNVFNKTDNNSGIQIDTTRIQVIETNDYTSYTFEIVQDSIERQQVLRNYMLTIVKDSIEIQHLVTYGVLGHRDYNMENISMERVYGDSLIPNFAKCGGSNTEMVSYIDCYMIPCSGPSAHTEVNDCPYSWNHKGIPPRRNCVKKWKEVTIADNPCDFDPGGGSSTDTGNGGSGGGENDSDQDDDENIMIPVDPNDGVKPFKNNPECNKIAITTKETDTSKVEYKFFKRFKEMRHDSVLNLNKEVSIGIAGQAQGLNPDRGNPNTQFPVIPGRIKAFAHTHNQRSTGTYSVFSWADLQTFATQSYQNKLDSSFTAFLVTDDGTEFVLTIKDSSKLESFFKPVIAPTPSSTDIIGMTEFINASRKWQKIYNDYFNGLNPPIDEIHSTTTDLNSELQSFLEMIKAADLGVELFRPLNTDPNKYEKLELGANNNIKTISC